MSDQMKIVVVDDDQGSCVFVKKILEKAGPYTVLTTTDPKTAQDLCLRENPDLIILDNVMPDIKGSHLVKVLRKDSRTKKTPIIMLTGKGEMVYTEEKEKFEWQPNTPVVKTRGELEEQKNPHSLPDAYGVDYYIPKPVNTQKFLEIINDILIAKGEKETLDEWKKYNT